MSGRSGYRKTDRKRNWNARPQPKCDYILRFTLPQMFAAFFSPGRHGYGVTIGYNNIAFFEGRNPAHCCELAADFFDRIGARNHPQVIAAQAVKLLPCAAHCLPRSEGFKKLTIDVEAVHDRVSRFADRARDVSICIRADEIAFTGRSGFRFHIFHDYSAP